MTIFCHNRYSMEKRTNKISEVKETGDRDTSANIYNRAQYFNLLQIHWRFTTFHQLYYFVSNVIFISIYIQFILRRTKAIFFRCKNH